MDPGTRKRVDSLLERVMDRRELERLRSLPFHDEGFGYDVFGCERESAQLAYFAAENLYRRYFRVQSTGHEHVPTEGRCILAANHSGAVPIDGVMVGIDLVKKLEPPRLMRAVVDNFVAAMPWVGLFMQRCGQVVGTRRNFEQLLEAGELVCVFPEGTKGISKPFKQRYQLTRFNVGFVELSLRYRAPIVPVAVVGAEEQAPVLYQLQGLGKLLGVPAVPVTPTFPALGPLGLFPYPARYHIEYGEPIVLHEQYPDSVLEDPRRIRVLAGKIRKRIQNMLTQRVRERRSIYF